MHPLDFILLFGIANVVAWPVALYVDDDDMRRIVGHMFASMAGAVILGFISQMLFEDGNKIILIMAGFTGSGLMIYLTRFRKWR